MEFTALDFDTIGPYPDTKINEALRRLTSAKEFDVVASFVFPDKKIGDVKALLHEINNADEFQKKFMHKAVRRVIETSSAGLTFDGFDQLNPETPYLFLANHRDIVLDSAILQVLLVEHGIPTSEISMGNNLLISPFISDFSKVNKMYVVYRGGTKAELLRNAMLLSAYIRYTITNKNNSLWIAQRNGRTKNGTDKTEEALLKMLNLSGKGTISENFADLNIVPLTISYEYEPCGTLKVNELYQNLQGPYVKKPGEDLNSILTGFQQYKGRVHISAGQLINTELEKCTNANCTNENIKAIAEIIDNQIYANFKLWPLNYAAYDLLKGTQEMNSFYTAQESEAFYTFVNKEIAKIDGDENTLRQLYLELYANPVINKLQSKK